MTDPLDANRQLWDEWTTAHVSSEFYDVPGFLAGGDNLDPLVLDALGDVTGKRVLHLQCHFGMDTLALGRRGAIATGVDFSPKAIAAARDLAVRADLSATFVESSVEALPGHLQGEFDIVFTSCGVLCWLGDLGRWAEVVAHFLAPGGELIVVDGHPFKNMFDNERDDDRLVPDPRYPYFMEGPVAWKNEGSYTGDTPDAAYEHHYEWMHSLSEIIMAVLGAGLKIERFEEHPQVSYQALPFLVEARPGEQMWRTPDGYPDLPLAFTLKARR